MPGFTGIIAKNELNNDFDLSIDSRLVNGVIKGKNYYLNRYVTDKFLDDKLFVDTDEIVILIDGVILNSRSIIEKYQCNSFADAIYVMFKELGEAFFNEFRGSFSGVLYDKLNDEWIIYTDHIGDKQIFYTETSNQIIFSSDIDKMIHLMRVFNNEVSLDEHGAYSLLTYGYMLEDYTLFKEIKKLNAGHYLKHDNNQTKIVEYFKLDNTPNEMQTEKEIIENIDRLFRKAVKLEFDKDNEYGYKHIVSLSGGLDSRMVTWIANDMEYENILNYTFSQCDYLDDVIAKKIASDLNHDFIFKSLDTGNFLNEIDEMVKITFGNVLYSGNAHGKSFYDLFNFSNFGMVHTGQIGDVIIGTFYSSTDDKKKFVHGDGAHSTILIDKVKRIPLKNIYKNEEIFKFYNRAFTGTMQGNVIIQQYTEAISPFLDIDFLNYCLSIPLRYRKNHYIYFEWIKEKYPKAANYKWEKINARITEKNITIMGRRMPISRVFPKIIDRLLSRHKTVRKNSMNPFDYWYNNNLELNENLNNYFKENINSTNISNELREDCIRMFQEGDTGEKTQVLTLLSAVKLFMRKDNE